MRTDITKINETTPVDELTEGLMVFAGGTSKLFNTGEWRTNTPVFKEDLCKQCLLCAPVCPDVSIPVVDGKRLDFDYDHCKGCGICAKDLSPHSAVAHKDLGVLIRRIVHNIVDNFVVPQRPLLPPDGLAGLFFCRSDCTFLPLFHGDPLLFSQDSTEVRRSQRLFPSTP